MWTTSGNCLRILRYMHEVHKVNNLAEVAAQELHHELGIPQDEVLACLHDLTAQGLVEGDLFPVNVWVRITEEGAGFLSELPDE